MDVLTFASYVCWTVIAGLIGIIIINSIIEEMEKTPSKINWLQIAIEVLRVIAAALAGAVAGR